MCLFQCNLLLSTKVLKCCTSKWQLLKLHWSSMTALFSAHFSVLLRLRYSALSKLIFNMSVIRYVFAKIRAVACCQVVEICGRVLALPSFHVCTSWHAKICVWSQSFLTRWIAMVICWNFAIILCHGGAHGIGSRITKKWRVNMDQGERAVVVVDWRARTREPTMWWKRGWLLLP